MIGTLVVDDQADMRLLISAYIDTANDGLEVVGIADGGPAALDLVGRVDPKVIVLDEMMPGMNGVETARRIRSTRPNQRIVLFSAHLDDEVRERAGAVGIDMCLHKDRLSELPDVLRGLANTG